MKIQSFISLSIFMLVLTLFVSGCNKAMEENDKQEITTIVGTGEFLSTIRQMNLSITKSGEISEQEIAEIIAPLFPVSIEYLNNNGYDYREDFQENDPNIIMTALTLADYAYT